jgi:hypothetical protein
MSWKNIILIGTNLVFPSNIPRYYILMPSIISHFIVMSNYYMIFGPGMFTDLSLLLKAENSKENQNQFVNEIEMIRESDLIDIELTENKTFKLEKIYKMNQKFKFIKSDKFTKFLSEKEKLLKYLANLSIASTLFAVCI